MNATDGRDPAVASSTAHWSLCLYVAGQSSKSLRALANLEALCAGHLVEGFEIEVVDLIEEPSAAERDHILAIPTLVRRRPQPLRKIVGDLSDTERVLTSLRAEPGRASHRRRETGHARHPPIPVVGPSERE